tara:strand:+ start:5829 stop:6497 length:669 start_codon:yes stop_codon:yes gene_type:complete
MLGSSISIARGMPPDEIADLIQRGRFQTWSSHQTSTAFTGTGAITIKVGHCELKTGTTNPSDALSNTRIMGLGSGDVDGREVNWDKDLRLFFILMSRADTANTTAAIQLKATGAAGNLADLGVGVQLANLALTSESYGSARDSNAIATLTTLRDYLIEIRVNAGTNVEFYLDGVLQVTHTGTALPTGNSGSTDDEFVWSVDNNSSADNGEIWYTPPIIWQER